MHVRLRRAISNMQEAVSSELYPLVFDPQTSGGLLASIPPEKAADCIQKLQALGYGQSVVIGTVKKAGDELEPVTLRP